MGNSETTNRLGVQWLIKLRWWAVLGQIVTIVTSNLFFNLPIPYLEACTILLIEISTNIALQIRLSSIQQPLLRLIVPLTLSVDILLLSAWLHFTGGPMNPFTFLFMVPIALGAILLPHRLSWGITILTIFCYGLLFIPHLPVFITTPEQTIKNICDINQADMMRHLHGMWWAFAITSCLITFFIAKIQTSFSRYHDTLNQLKHEQLNNERLSSLATLAAGAAHELSTPLATIGIAAGEIVYECKNDAHISADLKEDADLIKDQVHRCKDILFQMSVDAGSMQGEPIVPISTDRLLQLTLDLLHDTTGISITNKIPATIFNLPKRSVSWALKGLLKNAIDATGTDRAINLTCYATTSHLCFSVEDNGHGMTPEILKSAKDPFFTTKPVGEGMGLGLFLANSICNRFHGSLSCQSDPHKKTVVTITFALDQVSP